jgi:hypothetical protein
MQEIDEYDNLYIFGKQKKPNSLCPQFQAYAGG